MFCNFLDLLVFGVFNAIIHKNNIKDAINFDMNKVWSDQKTGAEI